MSTRNSVLEYCEYEYRVPQPCEPDIFVLNRAFLCRTMHFAVEPGFFVSKECYNVVSAKCPAGTVSLDHF